MASVAPIPSAVRRRALGQALLEAREEKGLSQEELAGQAGVHRNYIGRAERGEVNPALGTLEALAEPLGMSASELIADYERRVRG